MSGRSGRWSARVLAQLGGRTHRVALVVPDAVAKVSLLRLEKVPARAADLREIVKWQVRKSVAVPGRTGGAERHPGRALGRRRT